MTIKQLMATGYWRSKAELARDIGITRQAVNQWRENDEISGQTWYVLVYEVLPKKGMKRNEIKELRKKAQ